MLEYDHTGLVLDNNTHLYMHPHWVKYPPAPYFVHLLFGIFISFLGAIAVTGNVIVLWIFCRCRNLRTPGNFLLINLAISDFLLAITGFPMYALSSFYGRWIFKLEGCLFHAFAGATFGFASINTLACIAVERYVVIVHSGGHSPINYSNSILVIVFVWCISIAWSFPPLVGWGRFVPEGFGTTCSIDYLTRTAGNMSYLLSIFVGAFILPLSVIAFCYFHIFLTVFKSKRDFNITSTRLKARVIKGSHESKQKTELKTAKTLSIAVLCYCLSWSPYAVVALIGMFGDMELIFPVASALPVVFAKTSSLYNPFLYAISHPRINCKLKKHLPWSLFLVLTLGRKPFRRSSSSTKSQRSSATFINLNSRSQSAEAYEDVRVKNVGETTAITNGRATPQVIYDKKVDVVRIRFNGFNKRSKSCGHHRLERSLSTNMAAKRNRKFTTPLEEELNEFFRHAQRRIKRKRQMQIEFEMGSAIHQNGKTNHMENTPMINNRQVSVIKNLQEKTKSAQNTDVGMDTIDESDIKLNMASSRDRDSICTVSRSSSSSFASSRSSGKSPGPLRKSHSTPLFKTNYGSQIDVNNIVYASLFGKQQSLWQGHCEQSLQLQKCTVATSEANDVNEKWL